MPAGFTIFRRNYPKTRRERSFVFVEPRFRPIADTEQAGPNHFLVGVVDRKLDRDLFGSERFDIVREFLADGDLEFAGAESASF